MLASMDLPAAKGFATACPATAERLLLCMCPFVPLDMFNAPKTFRTSALRRESCGWHSPESFAAIPARQCLWLLLLPISAFVGRHDTVVHFGIELHNALARTSCGRQMATTLTSTRRAAEKGEPQITSQPVRISSKSSRRQNAIARTIDLDRGELDCKTTAPVSGVAEDQGAVCRRQVRDK